MMQPSRLATVLYRLGGHLRCRLILRQGEHPYLERYYLGCLFGYTFYLHRFVAPDGDEATHDHPWNALAICLAGGYTEERLKQLGSRRPEQAIGWYPRVRTVAPGWVNPIGARTFHRIQQVKAETWTLFVHGPRRKGWGFLDRDNGRTTYRVSGEVDTRTDWSKQPKGATLPREPFKRGAAS